MAHSLSGRSRSARLSDWGSGTTVEEDPHRCLECLQTRLEVHGDKKAGSSPWKTTQRDERVV